jgi:peptidoglycan/xylan/chitin deacetylase (PgdA/CDA1 family)
MRRLTSVGVVALLLMLPAATTRASHGPAPLAVLSSSRTVHRLAALTFDDGPSPYTPAILAVLHRYRVPATFFVVGSHVVQYPSIVKAEAEAGDDIGNHTYTHMDLEWLATMGVDQQLQATQQAVWKAAQVRPIWFRPPYGAVNGRVALDAQRLGLHTVLWSVDPRDWTEPGAGVITARVLAGVRPGSIVILHDGGGYRGETVQALPTIIGTLIHRGYRFIDLDTMFYPREIQAGRGARPTPRT